MAEPAGCGRPPGRSPETAEPSVGTPRATCPRCARPQRTCLCALVVPTANRTPVLVLQHPQERRHPKNSVALLSLSLARCEVVVGDRFAPASLGDWLPSSSQATWLLYPDVSAAPASSCAVPSLAHAAGPAVRLVVLDATWRKSLRLLLEHPVLAALPRLSLRQPEPTHYRAIRRARRSDQVSTLEATVHALSRLEGPAFAAAPLLQAFERFVASVAERDLRTLSPASPAIRNSACDQTSP